MGTISVDKLLDELAQATAEAGGVRTTSLNTIAFVDQNHDLLSRLLDRVESIGAKHASRSLVLVATQSAPPYAVRTEEIQLCVTGMASDQLRSIVHELLVPDVRTVLLWAGEHVTDERFQTLADLCGTIVLFSSVRDAGVQALRELLQIRETAAASKIRDLSYLRLFAWQDLVAQLFDDPRLAPELQSIARVEVAAGSEPEAYYLIGWLASRLNWEPCGAGEFCNPRGSAVRAEVRKEGAPRRIRSVCLHSDRHVFGAYTDEESDDVVCLTVAGKQPETRRCVPLHDVDMITLIERAIFERDTEDVYAQTLSMVAKLLEHAR